MADTATTLGRLAFVGGGVIAEALIRALLAAELVSPDDVTASDTHASRREALSTLGIRATESNSAAIEDADVIFLTVKPNIVPVVLEEIGAIVEPSQLVISVAAGLPLRTLERGLLREAPVIRVMPNTCVLVGEGATALCAGVNARAEHVAVARRVFESVGRAVEVPERLMDAVTGLSGSGPAYIYVVIEALTDGGVKLGLPRDVSLLLATQTVLGAAKMVLHSGRHPAELKDQVTTPGGTTMAGLSVLEYHKLRSTLIDAVDAATARSHELSQLHEPKAAGLDEILARDGDGSQMAALRRLLDLLGGGEGNR